MTRNSEEYKLGWFTDSALCNHTDPFSVHPTPNGPTDFRSQHPFAAAAIGVTLIGVGSVTVVPALATGILGAVGFTSVGVAGGKSTATTRISFELKAITQVAWPPQYNQSSMEALRVAYSLFCSPQVPP